MLRNIISPIFSNWDTMVRPASPLSVPLSELVEIDKVNSGAPGNQSLESTDPHLVSFVNDLSGWPDLSSNESRSPSPSFIKKNKNLKSLEKAEYKHLLVSDANEKSTKHPLLKNASQGPLVYEHALAAFKDGMYWIPDNTDNTCSFSDTSSLEKSPTSTNTSSSSCVSEKCSTHSKNGLLYVNLDGISGASKATSDHSSFNSRLMKTAATTHIGRIGRGSKNHLASTKKNKSIKVNQVANTSCSEIYHLDCGLQLAYANECNAKQMEKEYHEKKWQSSAFPILAAKSMELSPVFVPPTLPNAAINPAFEDTITTIYSRDENTTTPPAINGHHEF